MNFVYPANPPLQADEPPVANDAFFPAILPPDVRNAALLDGTVTAARLRIAIIEAIDTVNGELAQWAARQQAAGHATLSDVPASVIDATSAQVLRYQRAIIACVQARLAEANREIDTTPHSDGKADRIREKIEVKVSEHRQNMRWAISDILGIGRTTVELI